MKALTVTPGVPNSAQLVDVPPPDPASGALLIRGRAVGVCGTDIEIIEGGYGEAPAGEDQLILGHESLGEVLESPPGSGFSVGDLVVGIVRRPDPEPCDQCAVGQWDMCRNGLYTECGIKGRHGYAREAYRLDPEFAVRVDPALGELGVLLEPASVVAKACMHGMHMLRRTDVRIKTALITGAGPIGLLAALAARQAGLETHVVDIVEGGPKPDLVREIGAHYHAGSAADLDISPEVVIECTGIGAVMGAAGAVAAAGAVIALTGISAAPSSREVDVNAFNKHMVLTNKVLFGSVNAARSHYEAAAKVLSNADPSWLRRLISRRVPLERWQDVLERQPDDVKVVLELGAQKQAS
jgi:threonine dehydrogenase-like Zn-dependent dehydrogenase